MTSPQPAARSPVGAPPCCAHSTEATPRKDGSPPPLAPRPSYQEQGHKAETAVGIGRMGKRAKGGIKVTSLTMELVSAVMTLGLLGIILASRLLLTLASFPLLLLCLGMSLNPPRVVAVRRAIGSTRCTTNQPVRCRIEVDLRGGPGLVILADQLPGAFDLTEGSNFRVLWKGLGATTAAHSYTIRCSRSGHYRLGCLQWESRHLMELHAPPSGEVVSDHEFEVRPRLAELKRVRSASHRTRIPLPVGALARMGVSTLDFRELRQYSKGDSFRSINWKATSRREGTSSMPMVNEYEKEGKRVVWIFLDHSSLMDFGLSARNSFEYALEAVNDLASFYLRENCLVGLCTYNGGRSFIYPAGGQRQYRVILREIMQANAQRTNEGQQRQRRGLEETAYAYRRYLQGSRPLCVLVTRVQKSNAELLRQGVIQLGKYTGVARGRYPIMVVNVGGYHLAAQGRTDVLAAELLQSRDSRYLQPLKQRVSWVEWNPATGGLTQALMKLVAAR